MPAVVWSVEAPLWAGLLTAVFFAGVVMSFWATPHMTAGHLLCAGIWTVYIFVAVGYEERDMIAVFGDKDHDYMAKVPAILPFGRGK